MPSQSIPRSYSYCVQGSKQTFRCLNCGEEIKASGNYPFLADPVNNPWKLECPKCHMKFPTNDFEAYYKSGLNEHGNFDPLLANKGLLKNTLYPEKGDQWGVDDGNGYIDASGYKYTFIAYYTHWLPCLVLSTTTVLWLIVLLIHSYLCAFSASAASG